jgi:hypothetical protein
MNNKNNEILIDIEFVVKTSIYNVFIIKRMIFINDSKVISKLYQSVSFIFDVNFRFIEIIKEIKSE